MPSSLPYYAVIMLLLMSLLIALIRIRVQQWQTAERERRAGLPRPTYSKDDSYYTAIMRNHWLFGKHSTKPVHFTNRELAYMGLNSSIINNSVIYDIIPWNGNLVSQLILERRLVDTSCLRRLRANTSSCPSNHKQMNASWTRFQRHHRLGSPAYRAWAAGFVVTYWPREYALSGAEMWSAHMISKLSKPLPQALICNSSRTHCLIFDSVIVLQPLKSFDACPFDFRNIEAMRAPTTAMQGIHRAIAAASTSRGLSSASSSIVLIVQRDRSRLLVDSETGLFSTITDRLCALGLPVHVAMFDTISPSEQTALLSRAAVFISVHGADLTNMIYLGENSTVVEVVLRYGWCCDPIPKSLIRPDSPPCKKAPCKPFHKWDYVNMAHSIGLRYFYFDAEYLDPPYERNPITRHSVFVNSTELATLAAAAYADFRGGEYARCLNHLDMF